MERINGYLCIDDCKRKLANGKQKHYWVYIDGEEYYFKPCRKLKAYKELIGYYAAKILGIDACFYDFAVLNGQYGCISKSLRGLDIKLIPGALILGEYFSRSCELLKDMGLSESNVNIIRNGNRMDGDYLDTHAINNLEVIWQALEWRYGASVNIKELMDQFVMMYIYTIIMWDGDRHPLNWSLIESGDGVKLAPLIDNGLILSKFYWSNNYSVNFKDWRRGFYDSLRVFFRVSSSEYFDLFVSKFEELRKNFNLIFDYIEKQTGAVLPVIDKERLLDKFYKHCDRINEVIFEYKGKRCVK